MHATLHDDRRAKLKPSMRKIDYRELLFGLIFALYFICFEAWVATHLTLRPGMSYYDAIAIPLFISIAVIFIALVGVKKVNYTHMGLWFIALSLLFMFGETFLKLFNLQTTLLWNPSLYYTDQEKYTSALYALSCINAIGFGCYLVPAGDIQGRIRAKNEALDKHNRWVMRKVALICIVIGFAASAIQSVAVVSVTQAAGTYESYSTASTSVIVDDLSYLFVVGIIILFCSKELNSFSRASILVLACLYFTAVMVSSGSRKFSIFAILALVLCYLWTRPKKKIDLKTIAILVPLCAIFLNLIYVIREYRTDLESLLPNFVSSLTSLDFISGLAGETFAETGLTFFSLVGIVTLVPSVFPFEMGMTIIRSLFSFLPIGWLMGDFFQDAASTQVINTYTGLPVGASLIGDFYWNWGFVGGIVVSMLFGVAVGWLYEKLLKGYGVKGEILYFSIIYILLVGVRAGIFEIYRPLFMVIVLPILISMLFGRKNKKGQE